MHEQRERRNYGKINYSYYLWINCCIPVTSYALPEGITDWHLLSLRGLCSLMGAPADSDRLLGFIFLGFAQETSGLLVI